MEQDGLTQISVNRCEKLRWKGMYVETVWDPTVQDSNDQSFWCQHTYKCLGPDGKAVDEDQCNPARECFVEL
jgi:hypothetical protein